MLLTRSLHGNERVSHDNEAPGRMPVDGEGSAYNCENRINTFPLYLKNMIPCNQFYSVYFSSLAWNRKNKNKHKHKNYN